VLDIADKLTALNNKQSTNNAGHPHQQPGYMYVQLAKSLKEHSAIYLSGSVDALKDKYAKQGYVTKAK